jgi:glutamate synthase (NADPH/NADH) large chain
MVGQADRLEMIDTSGLHWKYRNLDLSNLLYKEPDDRGVSLFKQEEQDHGIDNVLDWELIKNAKPALEKKENVFAEFPISNISRAVGTMLSNEVSKIYLGKGLPQGTIHYKFKGSAGQSFGAFGAHGLKFELEGEANDYFGKGLSGAQLILYPDKKVKFDPATNIIAGNVAFYGATSGESYIRGLAGERFAVRNSGVKVVVEGVGDHGCEYMTGGIVVVLGETGRNFAAGMSGGIAYVYDIQQTFKNRCNTEMIEFDEINQEDLADLKRMIQNHHSFTSSSIAGYILTDWAIAIKSFVKVMPIDYKEALLKREKKAEPEKNKLITNG